MTNKRPFFLKNNVSKNFTSKDLIIVAQALYIIGYFTWYFVDFFIFKCLLMLAGSRLIVIFMFILIINGTNLSTKKVYIGIKIVDYVDK